MYVFTRKFGRKRWFYIAMGVFEQKCEFWIRNSIFEQLRNGTFVWKWTFFPKTLRFLTPNMYVFTRKFAQKFTQKCSKTLNFHFNGCFGSKIWVLNLKCEFLDLKLSQKFSRTTFKLNVSFDLRLILVKNIHFFSNFEETMIKKDRKRWS